MIVGWGGGWSAIVFYGVAGAIASGLILPSASTWLMTKLGATWRRDYGEHHPAVADLAPTTPVPRWRRLVVGSLGAGLLATVAALIPDSSQALPWAGYFLAMVLLLLINLDHRLLPDIVVIPTLWAGLFIHASWGNSNDAIYGAMVGYLGPALIMAAVKASTGKEMLGGGDVKAFAMAGAWFGMQWFFVLFPVFFLIAIFTGLAASASKTKPNIGTGLAHVLASITCLIAMTSSSFFDPPRW